MACAVLTVTAIYRDDDKLHTYRGPGASKTSIDIYSCAGKLIRSINVCPDHSISHLQPRHHVGHMANPMGTVGQGHNQGFRLVRG